MSNDIGRNSVKGTIFKLNINLTPIDGFHLEDLEFTAEVFTDSSRKLVVIKKEAAFKVDEDNYILCVDSSDCGSGRYYVRLTVEVPDSQVVGGKRIERATMFSGVTIDAC